MKLDALKKTPLERRSGTGRAGGMGHARRPSRAPSSSTRPCARRCNCCLAEQPREIVIAVSGTPEQRRLAAEHAVYAALVNSALLPVAQEKGRRASRCKKSPCTATSPKMLIARLRAQAAGNTLAAN